MEGKAVLFKKFAGIDAVDLEIDEKDPVKLAAIVRALEPSFGAVNLEAGRMLVHFSAQLEPFMSTTKTEST
jgi:malic enzyme